MLGLVPVRVSQLASLFMPYPAFSAMPTKRKSLAMVDWKIPRGTKPSYSPGQFRREYEANLLFRIIGVIRGGGI